MVGLIYTSVMKRLIKSIILIILLAIAYTNCQAQLINQQFSSTSPAEFSSTGSSWSFNYNYGAGNAYSGAYCARLSSASTGNGKYIYISINVITGNIYSLSFYSKRFCNTTINANETADQTTLLYSTTYNNTGCNNTWYSNSASYTATYTGVMYWQILCNTVYGGPTSIYLDDVVINESTPLPISLLYFTSHSVDGTNVISWATSNEYRNAYFTLYKSNNGEQWEPFYNTPGYMNSSTTKIYRAYDIAGDGVIYYRLKQTDIDGVYEIYDPISIQNPQRTYRSVLRVTDILGRETQPKTGTLQIVEYTDGTKIVTIGNNF